MASVFYILYDLYKNIFICPICAKKLTANDGNLICENNHTFNISKKGVVALQRRTQYYDSSIYTKELFESRKAFILSGVYDKLHTEIANIIKNKFDNAFVLDIGSGEGSHLNGIIKKCEGIKGAIALDISKPAIDLASGYLENGVLPIVGDCNNLPLMDKSVDVALDILSPLLISETFRVIKDNGIIIKVIPCENYLKEVRTALLKNEYTKTDEVLANIKQKANIIKSIKVNYKCELTKEQSDNLLKMTPLGANSSNKVEQLHSVTIDLLVLVLAK